MAADINELAPDFELSNQFGEPVRLSAFRGTKPVALVFFPLAFTGVCTTELGELRDNSSLFTQAGVELLVLSVDSRATLRVFSDRENYDFSLLADFWPHGAVARKYGALDETHGTAVRASFVIDITGVVRSRFETPRGIGRNFSSYREAIRKLHTPSS